VDHHIPDAEVVDRCGQVADFGNAGQIAADSERAAIQQIANGFQPLGAPRVDPVAALTAATGVVRPA
jgi:hypothetical protein